MNPGPLMGEVNQDGPWTSYGTGELGWVPGAVHWKGSTVGGNLPAVEGFRREAGRTSSPRRGRNTGQVDQDESWTSYGRGEPGWTLDLLRDWGIGMGPWSCSLEGLHRRWKSPGRGGLQARSLAHELTARRAEHGPGRPG